MLFGTALLLLACTSEPSSGPEEDSRSYLLRGKLAYPPMAATDPIVLKTRLDAVEEDGTVHFVGSSGESLADPVVVDEYGEPVSVEAVTWDSSWGSRVVAYAPTEPWNPGGYRVVGTSEYPDALSIKFAIGDYGYAEDFEPSWMVGRRWRVLEDQILTPTGIESTLSSYGQVYFTVTGVDDEAIHFVVDWLDRDGYTCRLYEGDGLFDSSGRITWSADSITFGTAPYETEIYDASITLLASETSETLAGGFGTWSMDGRNLLVGNEVSDPIDDFCVYAEFFFNPVCGPCADGVEACISSEFFHLTLEPVSVELDEDLEDCNPPSSGDDWDSGCSGWSCSTASTAMSIGGILLAFAGIARRRRQA